MAGTFALRIVSPEGDVLKEDVEFVVLPGGQVSQEYYLTTHP